MIECVCGLRIRNDGTFGDGRHRKLHVNPCEAWGRKARLADAIWEGPMLAQVAGITVDDDTIASVVAVLGSTRRPVEMDRARIDRRIRELALEHAAGDLADDAYLARLKALREARDELAEGSGAGVPAQRAIEWLRALAESSNMGTYRGKGRPDARHLRADRGRGTPRSSGFASRRRPTRTDWRWRCPKRLQWRARQVLGAR